MNGAKSTSTAVKTPNPNIMLDLKVPKLNPEASDELLVPSYSDPSRKSTLVVAVFNLVATIVSLFSLNFWICWSII